MAVFQNFGVIGGGAWGTALAIVLKRAGRDVVLWAREDFCVADINGAHENKTFLPGVALDPAIRATGDLSDLQKADALLMVAPVQPMRSLCVELSKIGLKPETPIIVCSKGIEQTALSMPSAIVTETLGQHPVAVLSGPTFAIEAARGQPTALTLATADAETGRALAEAIGSTYFRPYLSDDVVGAQIGGAVKNVLAIASGIVTGSRMGDNARAALITRGLAEMSRLAAALGGKRETLMGLSGLGDLVLTCAGEQSRNMSLGLALGQGRSLQEILAERKSVAEGVFSASAVVALAAKLKIEMPISAAVDGILNRGAGVAETVQALLARPLKGELD